VSGSSLKPYLRRPPALALVLLAPSCQASHRSLPVKILDVLPHDVLEHQRMHRFLLRLVRHDEGTNKAGRHTSGTVPRSAGRGLIFEADRGPRVSLRMLVSKFPRAASCVRGAVGGGWSESEGGFEGGWPPLGGVHTRTTTCTKTPRTRPPDSDLEGRRCTLTCLESLPEPQQPRRECNGRRFGRRSLAFAHGGLRFGELAGLRRVELTCHRREHFVGVFPLSSWLGPGGYGMRGARSERSGCGGEGRGGGDQWPHTEQ
jgi:hypothetical protein